MKFCCEMMKDNVYCVCEETFFCGDAEDKVINYSSAMDEYGIPIYDGKNHTSSSHIIIRYCPWCGCKLPNSRREEWCDRLYELGYIPFSDDIPVEFKTSAWYKTEEDTEQDNAGDGSPTQRCLEGELIPPDEPYVFTRAICVRGREDLSDEGADDGTADVFLS